MTARIEFLSCFFPAYNEAANIGLLVDEALETLPRFAQRFEIIVVDDGSTDATAAIVREKAASHPEVRLESHAENLGYGEALRTGLAGSRGTAVFYTDADRQFRLGDIDLLRSRFEPGVLAVGYRIERSDPRYRLVVARVYHWVLGIVFGLELRDVDCAFKLLGRDALDAVMGQLESKSAFISPELLIRSSKKGFAIREVPVPHYPRVAGRPKGATPRVIMRTIKEIVTMRRKVGTLRSPAARRRRHI